MDIGFYISELLDKKGEINVPGLGYFVQEYVPGYYHDAEGKFYPPTHRTQFDPQQVDNDDTLTQYIADVKNISLESSKYFTEKYITELKEDALVKEAPLGNLGWFYTEYGKLLFKPADDASNSSTFFGYPPVNLTRLGQEAHAFQTPPPPPAPEPPAPEPPVADTTEPFYTSESNAPVFQNEPAAEEEELYAEDEPKRSYWWLILLFAIIFVVLAVLGLYKYYPEQFARSTDWVQTFTGTKKVEKPVEVKKKEVVAIIPPKIDSATADSIQKVKTADSIAAVKQAKKDAIKNKKQKIADSIAAVKQAKLQAKADAKIKKQKTADSIAAAAKAKKQAKLDAKQAKIATNQSKATANPGRNVSIDYSKQWSVVVARCATQKQADAIIAKLKSQGIDPFIPPNNINSLILVAVDAFKTNDEARDAVITYKNKGLKDAYIYQIVPKR